VLDAEDAGVAAILVDDASRAWRTTEVRHVLTEGLREAGIAAVYTPSMRYPTQHADDPEGGFLADVMTAATTYQVAIQTRKVRRRKAAAARKGRAAGGGRRPFGWVDHARSAVLGKEAELIQEAARRIIDGDSSSAVCSDWHRRGIVTPTGKPWMRSNLIRMLRNPALVGRRVHKGEEFKAVWDPILDELTYGALTRTLDRRAKYRPGGPGENALLTGLGILYCGLCAGRLTIGKTTEGKRIYRCHVRPGINNCGGVGISAKALEEHVADELSFLIPPPNTEVQPSGQYAELIAEIERREALRDELAEDRDEGFITRGEYADRMRANADKLTALRGQLEATGDDLTDRSIAGNEWVVVEGAGIPEDQREDFRRALRAFVERIEVGRATPRGRRVDLDRVTITPKHRTTSA
jgi:site-specific DNA recombinase